MKRNDGRNSCGRYRAWQPQAFLRCWACLVSGSAHAAEITVLAGQGVVSAVRDLAPAFERASGHKVIISYELGAALMNKVNSDAPVDIVTHYPDAVDDLAKKGKVLPGTRAVFARAGIGVAVKAGAPKPDIGSTEAFKRAMLAAKSVAYSRAGASGLYTAKLMERLGIADAMAPKTKLVDGVPVARSGGEGRSRDRDAADQRHPAGRRRRLRRAAAARAAGLRRLRGRRAGGLEGAGSGKGACQVHVSSGGCAADQQERHGAGGSVTRSFINHAKGSRIVGPVSQFRSSPQLAARSDANFGIEGTLELYDSGAALNLKFL